MAQYGKTSYWDERYTKDPEPFDWYQRYSGIRDLINQYVKREDVILMAGCGNSRLTEDMFEDGYTSITNIDVSRVVIDQMIERYKDKPTLQWQQMNVTALDFPDETFDVVIAKATVDAVLCGEGSTANVAKFCSEVSRVLKPTGCFFIVSYGVPDNRLNYLEKEDLYSWSVTVHTVPKPTVSAAAVPSAEDANGVHYIYVCSKGGSAEEDMKGLTYWLNSRLYLALTNRTNSLSPIALRGPAFQLPETSQFQLLPNGQEPSALDVFHAVDKAFEDGKINVDSMEADEITYAGKGEPLLKLDVLLESAQLIKEKRHGVPLRVKTNGLVPSSKSSEVAEALINAGVEKVSIALLTDNPKLYSELMQPIDGLGFSEVCSFVVACSEAGLQVTCSTVRHPKVNISSVRQLAESLGATDFSAASYHP